MADRNVPSPPAPVGFHIRWREELVCTMDGQQFVVEITMGKLHVYFPTQKNWESCAPDWAKGRWERVKIDLIAWCGREKIPVDFADNAWVSWTA